jgi:arylsulfatase
MHPITEPWELYNLGQDPGQTNNLAAKHPERVARMAAMFEVEAERYNVNPVSNFGESVAFRAEDLMAEIGRRGGLWAYDGPISNIGFGAAPPIAIRPYVMTASIGLTTGSESGPIFAHGGSGGGMAAYLLEGVPTVAFRDLSGNLTLVRAATALPAGNNELVVTINRSAPKPMTPETVTVTIAAGGQTLVKQDIATVIPATYGIAETFDLGIDRGSAVSSDYSADQPFTGTLGKVTFQLQ